MQGCGNVLVLLLSTQIDENTNEKRQEATPGPPVRKGGPMNIVELNVHVCSQRDKTVFFMKWHAIKNGIADSPAFYYSKRDRHSYAMKKWMWTSRC